MTLVQLPVSAGCVLVPSFYRYNEARSFHDKRKPSGDLLCCLQVVGGKGREATPSSWPWGPRKLDSHSKVTGFLARLTLPPLAGTTAEPLVGSEHKRGTDCQEEGSRFGGSGGQLAPWAREWTSGGACVVRKGRQGPGASSAKKGRAGVGAGDASRPVRPRSRGAGRSSAEKATHGGPRNSSWRTGSGGRAGATSSSSCRKSVVTRPMNGGGRGSGGQAWGCPGGFWEPTWTRSGRLRFPLEATRCYLIGQLYFIKEPLYVFLTAPLAPPVPVPEARTRGVATLHLCHASLNWFSGKTRCHLAFCHLRPRFSHLHKKKLKCSSEGLAF